MHKLTQCMSLSNKNFTVINKIRVVFIHGGHYPVHSSSNIPTFHSSSGHIYRSRELPIY